MAINPNARYPGNTDAPNTEYPYGRARNVTASGDDTGTPWEQDIANDLFGFQQALLHETGAVPSGTPDKVGASQYLGAIKAIAGPEAGVVGQVDLFPAGMTLQPGHLRMDGGEHVASDFPALAGLMPSTPPSYSEITPPFQPQGSPGSKPSLQADDNYIYMTIAKSPGLVVLDADTLEPAPSAPDLGKGAGCVFVDASFIYVGGRGFDGLRIFRTGTFAPVAGAPAPSIGVRGLFADADYIYIVSSLAPYLAVFRQSDYSEVTGIDAPDGYAEAVWADTDYIYVAGHADDGAGIMVFDRSDFSRVLSVPTPGITRRGGYAVTADADYIYLGHGRAPYLTVLNRSDFSEVAGVPALASNPRVLLLADGYLYAPDGSSPGGPMTILSVPGFEEVPAPPEIDSETHGLAVARGALFVSFSTALRYPPPYLTFGAFEITGDGFEIPAVASPDPILEYRIKAL